MQLITRYLNSFVRAADGADGAGGASNTPPADSGTGEGSTTPPAQSPTQGGTPPADGGPPPSAAPGGSYKPNGVAAELFGETNEQTIDNLAKALKTFHDRDAAGGGVPSDAKDYLSGLESVPDKAKGYFDALAGDPVFAKIGAVALEAGVPKATFGKLLGTFLEANVEAGMFDSLIDVDAERAALVPDSAKALPKAEQDVAIDRRMNDNIAWMDAMVKQGMPKEAADYLQLMTFDTAKGHQAIEFFRARLEGAGIKPIGNGNGAGADGPASREALRAEMALTKHKVGHPDFDRASYDALMERYQRLPSN